VKRLQGIRIQVYFKLLNNKIQGVQNEKDRNNNLHRYGTCGGSKCLRAMIEHVGGFSLYDKNEELVLVGYANCGGCPGGNIEYVPEEMKKNYVDVIHFATGMIVGYPPCPRIKAFKEFIEKHYEIPVVVGTHPIPEKYLKTHNLLSFWKNKIDKDLFSHMVDEDIRIMKKYN